MKTLIIGLGGIGQRHLRNLRMLQGNGMEIIAYDPRPNPPVLTDNLKIEEGANLQEKYGLRISPTSNRLWQKSRTLRSSATPPACMFRRQSRPPGRVVACSSKNRFLTIWSRWTNWSGWWRTTISRQ